MAMTIDHNSWPAKLVMRVGKTLRTNKNYTNDVAAKRAGHEKGKLRKRNLRLDDERVPDQQAGVDNDLGEREYSIFSDATTLVEPQKDHTDLVHQMSWSDNDDEVAITKQQLVNLYNPEYSIEQLLAFEKRRQMLDKLPKSLWLYIASMTDPASAAFLALSCRTMYQKFGPQVMLELRNEANRHSRNKVLHHFDKLFPDHLLCFHCTTYHSRLQPGQEMLKINHLHNPVFMCPRVKSSVLPRMRLTHGRELPYTFVQLAIRESQHSPLHGLSHKELARHWKCKDSTWSHRTRYLIIDGRLTLRVRSTCFAPPDLTETAQRHLLYDREEYTPFFSVCAHWRDGELMNVCKCMLSHVPQPPKSYLQQLKEKPSISRAATKPNFIITGCDFCRPARRCQDCPSEYLVEIQMVEDPEDPVQRFKHALVVTRWADLGDGSSPFTSPEWTSILGEKNSIGFDRVGRRAISGQFESKISGSVPGQRMISLNPKKEKRGTEDSGWY